MYYIVQSSIAIALYKPTHDESDENRLTRTIASQVSRNCELIVECSTFVERAMLFRDMGGIVHDDIDVAGQGLGVPNVNTPTGSYIGPNGSNANMSAYLYQLPLCDQDLQINGSRIWKFES